MRTSTVALSRIRNARKITLMLPGKSQQHGNKVGKKFVLFCTYPVSDFSICPVTPKMEVGIDSMFDQEVLARVNYTSVIFK